jgi:hypothetical protein
MIRSCAAARTDSARKGALFASARRGEPAPQPHLVLHPQPPPSTMPMPTTMPIARRPPALTSVLVRIDVFSFCSPSCAGLQGTFEPRVQLQLSNKSQTARRKYSPLVVVPIAFEWQSMDRMRDTVDTRNLTVALQADFSALSLSSKSRVAAPRRSAVVICQADEHQ